MAKTLHGATKHSGASTCRVRMKGFPSVAQKGRDENSGNIQLTIRIKLLKSKCTFLSHLAKQLLSQNTAFEIRKTVPSDLSKKQTNKLPLPYICILVKAYLMHS